MKALPRARTLVATSLLICAALVACNRDSVVGPASLIPSAPASHTTAVSLGTYSIPIAPTNTVNDALQPNTNTGIFVAAGTYYRVRVKGSVIVSPNPAHQAYFPGATYSATGTYGPNGRSSYNELRVNIMRRNVSGSATTYLPFLNPITGTSGPDSARTDVYFAEQAIEIQAGRQGISGVQRDNQNNFTAGFYALTASQVVTVESVTDVAHLVANPNYIRAHQLVVFTASRDDGQSPGVQSWHWQVDPGATGTSNNPCWWNNPCQLNIDGSGTMTVYTNVGPATAHVTVYSSFTLNADKTTAYYGDTVTFTPLYNLVAGPAARWRWVAADTSDHSSGCANSVSPCKKKMVGSGTMWAYTATSGGDSASVQVTVRDKFELRAAPSLIRAGAVVTFRPLLNGQPAAAARWRWVPEGAGAVWDNVAGCTNGATECHRATFVSGVMWAFRATTGGDSASALVTVSADCGGAFSLAPSRQPSAWRMIGRPTAPGDAAIRALTTTTMACTDSARTAPDASTGSLPTVALHVTVETPGIDAVPGAGDSSWPIGTVVPFQFLPKAGYDNPVVFVDDTLQKSGVVAVSSGTVIMSTDHTIRSATDTNFAARPGIAALRQRLRAVVVAADKPSAYASYLTWALDTALTSYSNDLAVDDNVALAEYLEFDPIADAGALGQLDDALANYKFEVRGGPLSHTIHIVPPRDFVLANRVPGGQSASTNLAVQVDTAVMFIFVNGIRTLERGAFQTRQLLAKLLEDPISFPHAHAAVYWNRNLRGEIIRFADNTFGCGGYAGRDLSFRQRLTTLVRYKACKSLSIVTIPIFDDVGSAALQFMSIQWAAPEPPSGDVERLAKTISDYHQAAMHTVVVGHSQGNMVFALAAPKVAAYDGVPLQASACTAAMSLAAPINKENFNIAQTYLRGMTIKNDILLQLFLPNNFPPYPDRYENETSAQADAAIATAFPGTVTMTSLKWGASIHDVDRNYLSGSLRPTVKGFLEELYDTCMP